MDQFASEYHLTDRPHTMLWLSKAFVLHASMYAAKSGHILWVKHTSIPLLTGLCCGNEDTKLHSSIGSAQQLAVLKLSWLPPTVPSPLFFCYIAQGQSDVPQGPLQTRGNYTKKRKAREAGAGLQPACKQERLGFPDRKEKETGSARFRKDRQGQGLQKMLGLLDRKASQLLEGRHL
eukprot:1140453-Pelagomonas_calceolata.AAC.3